MKDFTLKIFKSYINQFLINSYKFQVYSEYIKDTPKKENFLRHDVDSLPENSLKTAQIEYNLGVKGSYYFRIVPQSNHPKIIEKIASLGHEIGYHYEDLALCKGNMEEAIKNFENNLKYFRQFYPVKTICMHGSPLSKYDNRKLWVKYNYRDFGIIGEPYFDVDFSKVLYLTDTGRRWDGEAVSVRDKIASTPLSMTGMSQEKSGRLDRWSVKLEPGEKGVYRDENNILRHNFHSTNDIIKAAENEKLPVQLMITVHPQRWTNNPVMWTRELFWQGMKNQVKRMLVRKS